MSQLKSKGVDKDVIHELNTILQECEIALYAPGHTDADMQEALTKTEQIIKHVQGSIT